MPELPEVESLRRGLEPHLLGQVIARARVTLDKQVKNMPARKFEAALSGQKIIRVGRRAKFLVIQLERGDLVIHLGMSGQVTFRDPGKPDAKQFLRDPYTGLQRSPGQHRPDKHTHAVFQLKGQGAFQYRDPRQFGRLLYFEKGQLEKHASFTKLGMEPLEPGFTWPAFSQAMAKKATKIKALLLSQHPVAGLGNIYVDEALWRAEIHPLSSACRIPEPKLKALFKAIPRVLQQGIKNRGTTLMDYRNSDGSKGSNQEKLMAYGQEGRPCKRCGAKMTKTLIAQRGTVYCPACQRPPRKS